LVHIDSLQSGPSAMAPARWMGSLTGRVSKLIAALPEGRTLPDETWQQRHRVILWLIWIHVAVLWLFGALTGHSALDSAIVAGSVAVPGALAAWPQRSHRFRAVLASLGLLFSSIGLVGLSGGLIEMHFHFFIMVAVIALYQDWIPFLVALGTVVLHHGLASAFDPAGVYNHHAALAHPWLWAAIHGGFILGMCAACLVSWRFNEIEYVRRIHEQERADQVVRDSEAHFRSLVQNAADIISVVDESGIVRYTSPSHQRLLGYEATEVIGGHVLDRVHLDDRPMLEQVLIELLAHPDASRTVEIRLRSKDGSWRTLDMIAVNRLHDHAIAGIVINARDISERKALEEQLIHQAFHDPLTGLPNRALFMDRLGHALERAHRSAGPLAVLYLDFDQFKIINDSLGHGVGDDLIRAMSRRLVSCTRTGDTVARLGGDEFAILVEDSETAAVGELAERVNAQFGAPFHIDGHDIVGSVSVGVACKESPEESADDLVRNADIAMYAAKRRGKGRFALYDASMFTNGMERLHLEKELRQAVERGEFRVFYQPIINLATGELDEVEALVRWQHPSRGLVLPGDFIPFAEESGLIVPIGMWVLTEACRQVRRWQDEHPSVRPLAVSVNLSPRMFQDATLLDEVARVLAQTGLDPSALRLEITEGVVIQNPAAAAKTMTELKALGVKIAMDDFGTGYSSFASLQSFPFDILKIDQSFVRGLRQGTDNEAIVQAIIQLASSLNLTVTGEGIETEDQLRVLRALGSDRGQGYLFSRPKSAAEMELYLGAQSAETMQPARH
jgi:diguanylate cyclase (GGDEF)-like protein/PAS domain S-box-containing protein